MVINSNFPKYEEYSPQVPVWCVTPNGGGCIHRFFDTSPVSPSGRYLALLRMPREERLPRPGETAQVILIDLREGVERVIAETHGWETQMGANINWGTDDGAVYFNDADISAWEPFAWRMNPLTGEKKRLGGTVYRISPDGKHIISADMKRMRRTQYGYGVMIPDEKVPRNYGFRGDDGLYATDTETGECKLLISIREIFGRAVPEKERIQWETGEVYGFHCKYNPQGDRLIFTMRAFAAPDHEPWDMLSAGPMDFWVVTMKPDGNDVHVAVGPEEWIKGGHHINWHPDGKSLSMNLAVDGDGKLYFVRVNYDGSGLQKILEDIPGSGHPTVHPDGRHILTDSYADEPVAFGDGTVPIRLIDLKTHSEQTVIRVNVGNPFAGILGGALRVDPHPAWAPDFRHVVFNGFVRGTRRVFIADFSKLL